MTDRKQSNPQPTGEFLTVVEVAQRLNVKPRLVYDLVARRRIPHYRISRGVLRFSASELSAWLKMQKGA